MSEFANKTVLITGATGLIGSHLVDKLMGYGDVKVIALSRSENKLKMGFREYLDKANFRIIAQDVSFPIDSIGERLDYIFHAAGPMEGKVIANTPVAVFEPNILGTINCLEYLKKQGDGRLIVFSSVTVYANNSDVDKTVTEDDTDITEKLSSAAAVYSQSKRISEVIAKSYLKQYCTDYVVARFSTVYGATRFIPDTAFFEFIKKGKEGKQIILNTAGLPRRDNIYIDDAVDGVLKIAESGIKGEAYNVSSNGDLSNYASVDEIAVEIASVANKKYVNSCCVQFKEKSNGARKPGLKLDNTKLKKLGWEPNVSLSEGIALTFENLNFK